MLLLLPNLWAVITKDTTAIIRCGIHQCSDTYACVHLLPLFAGYEFDTGIHYIGDMNAGSSLRFMMDELTEGQLQWAPLNNTYDVVALGDPSEARRVPIVQGKKEQIEMLIKQFPEEEEAIRNFYQKMSVVRRMGLALGFLKLLPLWCSKLLIRTGVFTWLFPFFKDWRKTVQQVMDELTDNNDLKVVMSYNFMDYGELCSHVNVCVCMHACMHTHSMEYHTWRCGRS